MNKTDQILSELKEYVDEEKKIVLPRFFKTGKGQYGEGDKFLGITVPNIRLVAKQNVKTDFDTIKEMISSEWHEVRMCALLIMVQRFPKADEETRKAMYDFYLQSTSRINNWDLVDLTAPTIVGKYLFDKNKDILYQLADSDLLWDNRIAMIATFAFIKEKQLDDTYRLAEKFLHHPHDLMQKAVGWMLREAGKRDYPRLYEFVDKCHDTMPRTMLRYAIEKFPEEARKQMMKRS